MDIEKLIEFLEGVLANPWMLMFVGVWVVGYMLKEKTTLDNGLIPWIVLVVALTLGLFLIELSLGGAIVGLLIGYIQIGFYDQIKGAIKLWAD